MFLSHLQERLGTSSLNLIILRGYKLRYPLDNLLLLLQKAVPNNIKNRIYIISRESIKMYQRYRY